jgi:glycosyltransferase involved in cell wall biosynthesis
VHVVILAASRHPVAEPFAGGLESLTWHLVRGLRARGVEVTVFAGEGSDPGLGAELLRTHPLRLSHAARSDPSMVPETWLREHDAYLQVMLALQSRPDIDVVHNNSLHHLPVVMARALLQPLVTTLHTPPTPWLEPAVQLAGRSPARRPGYVAVSRHTARSWSHVTPSEVVHNGVDVDRWPLGTGGAGLAWAGRIVPEKAPHLAVEMARAVGLPLRLAGPVGNLEYFESRLRPLLGGDVEYVGHLTILGLAQLFGSAAATVVTPVWDEPYGLVAAESLACGTPVVALDRGGLGEVIDEHTGVLVSPRDPVAAAPEAVGRALELDRLDCRRRAETACSVERMVDEYLGVYARLAAPVAA